MIDKNEDDARAAEEVMAPNQQACTTEDDENFRCSITTDNGSNVIYSNLPGQFPIE